MTTDIQYLQANIQRHLTDEMFTCIIFTKLNFEICIYVVIGNMLSVVISKILIVIGSYR